MSGRRQVFPLVSRRPPSGLDFGMQSSRRRGQGSDIAGSRPYAPGDRIASIDWAASARRSAVLDEDAFVVRQTFAEHAPRVVVVRDRRPSMRLYEPPLPFLSKPGAVREAVGAILASARAARAAVGWLDVGAEGATWLPPRNVVARQAVEQRLDRPTDAPAGSLDRALGEVAHRASEVPAGSFVFVLSDFLEPVARVTWLPLAARGLDVVPVVVQDPVWEASFPDVAGVLVPLADATTGETASVRLDRAEVEARRDANAARAEALRRSFRAVGADVVTLDSAEPVAIDARFAEWAARRRAFRRAGRLG